MRASRAIRRVEGLTTDLCREMVHIERLARSAGDHAVAFEDVAVPDVADHFFRVQRLSEACRLLEKASLMLADAEGALQEVVYVLDDAQEKLGEVAGPPSR